MGRVRVRTRLRVGEGVRVKVGFNDSVGSKVDKTFLWAPLVPVERQAPLAPIESLGWHL